MDYPTSFAVGIDLGTTYSAVDIWRTDGCERVPIENKDTLASVVAFTADERVYGEAAKQLMPMMRGQVVYDSKRMIGKKITDPEIIKDKGKWPFDITQVGGKICYSIWDGSSTMTISAEEVSSMLLEELKRATEAFLGTPIKDVIITCPALFGTNQREATKRAAELAGLNVIQMIDEPTAAALAFGRGNPTGGRERKLLVFDYGGGTLDVSYLIQDVAGKYSVKATAGDNHCGGQDLDNILTNFFIDQIKQAHPEIDRSEIETNKIVVANLKAEAERAKLSLSQRPSVPVRVDNVLDGINFEYTLQRAKFNEICNEEFEKCMACVKKTVDKGGIQPNQIDTILLVGGSSKIPRVQEMLTKYFNKQPSTTVNPLEAVARGAAIFSAIKQGILPGMNIEDVIPLSLGIEVVGGLMSVVIPGNSRRPISRTKSYTNSDADMTYLPNLIYEGDDEKTEKNYKLGELPIPIEKGPAHSADVDVTFTYDENAILHITAVNNKTTEKRNLTIQSEEINDMHIKEMKLRERLTVLFREKRDSIQERSVEIKQQFESGPLLSTVSNKQAKISEINKIAASFDTVEGSLSNAAIEEKYNEVMKRMEEWERNAIQTAQRDRQTAATKRKQDELNRKGRELIERIERDPAFERWTKKSQTIQTILQTIRLDSGRSGLFGLIRKWPSDDDFRKAEEQLRITEDKARRDAADEERNRQEERIREADEKRNQERIEQNEKHKQEMEQERKRWEETRRKNEADIARMRQEMLQRIKEEEERRKKQEEEEQERRRKQKEEDEQRKKDEEEQRKKEEEERKQREEEEKKRRAEEMRIAEEKEKAQNERFQKMMDVIANSKEQNQAAMTNMMQQFMQMMQEQRKADDERREQEAQRRREEEDRRRAEEDKRRKEEEERRKREDDERRRREDDERRRREDDERRRREEDDRRRREEDWKRQMEYQAMVQRQMMMFPATPMYTNRMSTSPPVGYPGSLPSTPPPLFRSFRSIRSPNPPDGRSEKPNENERPISSSVGSSYFLYPSLPGTIQQMYQTGEAPLNSYETVPFTNPQTNQPDMSTNETTDDSKDLSSEKAF